MNEELFSYLQSCLLHCSITINSLEQLNGMILPRDFFLDMEKTTFILSFDIHIQYKHSQ